MVWRISSFAFFLFLSSVVCGEDETRLRPTTILPRLDNYYDFGSSEYRWRNGHFVDLQTANLTVTSSASIKGVTDGGNAGSGYVGETVSTRTISSTNFPSTTQFGDLAAINLTAGDWLVSISAVAINSGATITEWSVGISTTSGNSSAGLTTGDNQALQLPPTGTGSASTSIPGYRVSLSSSKTVYLKYSATFAAGTPTARGRITGVRIR
jgi:hypothetical protein